MRWVSCHGHALQIDESRPGDLVGEGAWTPQSSLIRSAVHELLFDPAEGEEPPMSPAWWCVHAALEQASSPMATIWCDPEGTVYPPALVRRGQACEAADWQALHLLRPRPADLIWAVSECLRCKGVGAVVAQITGRLSRVEARRLQLAAEEGGSVGILLRCVGKRAKGSDIYAASTRWRVRPAPGELTIQRWKMELVHGHGRQVGQSYLLECRRGLHTNFNIQPFPVHSPAALVHHTALAPPARAWG